MANKGRVKVRNENDEGLIILKDNCEESYRID